MRFLILAAAVVGLCPAQPRWMQMEPVPPIPSGRAVNDGAWLEPVSSPGGLMVYAAKGNRTSDFHAYSVVDDSWYTMPSVPMGMENKTVDEGSKGASDDSGNFIYVTKGNNSFGFHRFNVVTREWTQMPDVPAGPDSNRLRGGTDLVYVDRGGGGYVYLLKGTSGEFYRFDVAGHVWSALPHAPAGSQPLWLYGSWLTFDGAEFILAHKAGRNELWVFDLAADSWLTAPRTGMPLVGRGGQTVQSGDGGTAEWHAGSVYALKGNSTAELWRYFLTGDSWCQLEDIPVGIGGGGALAAGDSGPGGSRYLYSLVGDGRNDFWRYRAGGVPGVGEKGLARLGRVLVVPSPLRGGRGALEYSLSGSGPVRLSLCDLTGRRHWRHRMMLPDSGRVPLALPGLAPGTYFLLVETCTESAVQRVVVTR